jgi:predicted amidohydrolase
MTIVAAVQMTASHAVDENLLKIEQFIKNSVAQGAAVVVLPENAVIFPIHESERIQHAEHLGAGQIQSKLADLARHFSVWLIAGTIPVLATADKVFAACIVWDNTGKMVAQYNKAHLFDTKLPGTQETYAESMLTVAGNDVVVIDSPIGRLGLSVCYDLRFPELYRKFMQNNVEVIIVASAFTRHTGQAHWECLLRARAIENLSYVVAPNQSGIHSNKRATYGHTSIVDPWGIVAASLENGEGVIVHDIDLKYLHSLRNDFPVLQHARML